MYAVETLKKNVTDLFSTLAFLFDEDADEVIDFILIAVFLMIKASLDQIPGTPLP